MNLKKCNFHTNTQQSWGIETRSFPQVTPLSRLHRQAGCCRGWKTVKPCQRMLFRNCRSHGNTIVQLKAVLLNLFDVAAHFSPRLWFWAHFTKKLFQNSWLGVILALSRNISRPTG